MFVVLAIANTPRARHSRCRARGPVDFGLQLGAEGEVGGEPAGEVRVDPAARRAASKTGRYFT